MLVNLARTSFCERYLCVLIKEKGVLTSKSETWFSRMTKPPQRLLCHVLPLLFAELMACNFLGPNSFHVDLLSLHPQCMKIR